MTNQDNRRLKKLEEMFEDIMQKHYYKRYGTTKADFLLALEEAYEHGAEE